MKENDKDKQESSVEKEEKVGLSDGWVTLFIIIVMASACVAAWWLAKRETVPGAPGAPVGCLYTAGPGNDR